VFPRPPPFFSYPPVEVSDGPLSLSAFFEEPAPSKAPSTISVSAPCPSAPTAFSPCVPLPFFGAWFLQPRQFHYEFLYLPPSPLTLCPNAFSKIAHFPHFLLFFSCQLMPVSTPFFGGTPESIESGIFFLSFLPFFYFSLFGM